MEAYGDEAQFEVLFDVDHPKEAKGFALTKLREAAKTHGANEFF